MTPHQPSSKTTAHQLTFLNPEGEDIEIAQDMDAIPVDEHSTIGVARVWFRQHLMDQDRPHNTIESYIYDLVVLEQRIRDKPLFRISETDIAMYLADATSKVTRKRRLTSLKAFFRYVVHDLKVLTIDPSDSFSPHPLELHRPEILTESEQERIVATALTDEAWSAAAIWLMLHLGLGRAELLALKRDHIDRTAEAGPDVLVAYDTPGKRTKQRTLRANEDFGKILANFVELREPTDVLFPYGPQAVNGMVERVAANAGIQRRITPQLLRQTAAVEMARQDKTINELLHLLGLANDTRNRETVRMYMDMATERGMRSEDNEA